MSRAAAPAAAAAAAVALALAGCGHKAKPAAPQDTRGPAATPTAQEAIQAALDRRARREARRGRRIDARQVGYVIDRTEIDGDHARVAVRLVYRVRGIAGQFGSRRVADAVRRKSHWRIERIRVRRQLAPWEISRYRVVRSKHFVVLEPQGVDVRAGGLLEAVEDGYARMRDVLAKGRLRRRYLVVVARDAPAARKLTSSIRGLESLTALTDTEVQQEGAAQRVRSVTSQRLLVLWPAFTALDPDSRRTVVAHELTHAAVAPNTSGRTPAWLSEGLALYVSGDRRVGQAAQLVAGASARATRRALSLSTLSDPEAIAHLSGDGQGAAYAYASSAAFYIAERFGRKRLLRLYDAYNDEELVGEPGELVLTDEAVRKVLRIPLQRLERDLRTWIVTRAVVDPFAP